MLPKKLHIQPIERFHAEFKKLSARIGEIRDKPEHKEECEKLCMKYFKMSNLWVKIDNFCEMTVDHELNILENEPEESWDQELD